MEKRGKAFVESLMFVALVIFAFVPSSLTGCSKQSYYKKLTLAEKMDILAKTEFSCGVNGEFWRLKLLQALPHEYEVKKDDVLLFFSAASDKRPSGEFTSKRFWLSEVNWYWPGDDPDIRVEYFVKQVIYDFKLRDFMYPDYLLADGGSLAEDLVFSVSEVTPAVTKGVKWILDSHSGNWYSYNFAGEITLYNSGNGFLNDEIIKELVKTMHLRDFMNLPEEIDYSGGAKEKTVISVKFGDKEARLLLDSSVLWKNWWPEDDDVGLPAQAARRIISIAQILDFTFEFSNR